MKFVLKIFVSLITLTLVIVGLLAVYISWFDAPSYNVDIKPINIESTDSQIAIGEKIALNYCVSCHLSSSRTLSGKIMIEHQKWGTITSANLTKHSESILSSYSDSELFTFLKTGVKNNGKMVLPMMPKLSSMSDEDLFSLIAFLRSDNDLVKATPNLIPESKPSFLVKALMKFEIKPVISDKQNIITPPQDNTISYGSYLVNGRYSCYECHSRSTAKIDYINPTNSEGYLGGGSKLMVFGNQMGIRSANITPHLFAGLGHWTFDDFKNALENGKRPDGKILRPPMNRMKLDSIEFVAIWNYLKTVEPNSNQWDYDNRIEMPQN